MNLLTSMRSTSSQHEGEVSKSLTRKYFRRVSKVETHSPASFDGAKRSEIPCTTTKMTKKNRRRNHTKSMGKNIVPKIRTDDRESIPSSKPLFKAWTRRVFQRESPPNSDGRSGLFSGRHRIFKRKLNTTDGNNSPTNSRTVTDESEESPRRMLIVEQLSFRNTVPMNNANHDRIDNGGKHMADYEHSHNVVCDDICNDEEEKDNTAELPKYSFKKSEIIDKLFPLGYPSSHLTENNLPEEVVNDEKKVDQNDMNGNIDSTVPYRSPFLRSEVIDFLFPMGHPDDKKTKQSNSNFDLVENDSPSEQIVNSTTDTKFQKEIVETINDEEEFAESKGHDCDKFIGLTISFDPTWELLNPDETDDTTCMAKSRLKKFHEIENYADSILGNFTGEGSSDGSPDIFADVNMSFDTYQSPLSPEFNSDIISEGSSSISFHLGYHFDEKRFPPKESSEIELRFYPDDNSSSGCTDDSIEIISFTTSTRSEALSSEQYDFFYDSEESKDYVTDDIDDSIVNLDKIADCVNPLLFLPGTQHSFSLEIQDDDSIIFLDESSDEDDSIIFLNESIDCADSLPYLADPEQLFELHTDYMVTDSDEDEDFY